MAAVARRIIMAPISKFASVIAIGAIFLCFSSGCTTGTLISGMSSASSGVSHTSGPGSKVVSYKIVPYEDAVKGTIRAAEALSLENKKKEIKESRAKLRYADEKDQVVDIIIERRTATITTIQADAGFFGPKGFSRLMLLQILKELNKTGVYPEDGSD